MYMHNTIVHHNVQKSNLLMSQLSNCTSTNQALDIMNKHNAIVHHNVDKWMFTIESINRQTIRTGHSEYTKSLTT